MKSDPRERLIEAGMNLLDHAGPEALQARTVAAQAGASTMAVYTHFGGMPQLVEQILAASFRQFGATLSSVPTTDDPLTDFFAMGHAYWGFAVTNPQRYKLMFGLTPQMFNAQPPGGAAAFDQLVGAVARIVESGRVRDDDHVTVALRLWSMIHGVVLLELAGMLDPRGHTISEVLGPMTVDVFVGMGARRAHVEACYQRAVTGASDQWADHRAVVGGAAGVDDP